MSSLIGHAITGGSIALAGTDTQPDGLQRRLPWLVLLAVCADFDYLLFWTLGIDLRPRITHSLAFAVVAATAIWRLTSLSRSYRLPPVRFPLLLLAACSHPLLDLLVGVHPLPLFWPFISTEIASTIGVLPSAAHVSVTNYYLWRNLLIEMGVLLPALAFMVAWSRGATISTLWCKAILIAPFWIACLVWSIGLQR